MNRTILGVGRALMARVDALSTAVAASAEDPKVQAALQASVASAQQTAQTAQTAATTASQAAAQALANTATLEQTVAALNRLSEAYVAAVKVSQDDRAALHTQLDALALRKTTIALGRAATPALILGASADVTVTLTRAMPNTTYEVDVLPVAALLGKATITAKSRTTTTVTLTVKAAAVLVAGSLDVVAWHHG